MFFFWRLTKLIAFFEFKLADSKNSFVLASPDFWECNTIIPYDCAREAIAKTFNLILSVSASANFDNSVIAAKMLGSRYK